MRYPREASEITCNRKFTPQNPDQDATRNVSLPNEPKDSIATMMTEMMDSFKHNLLTDFEDYFTSPPLAGDLTNFT